LLPAAVNAAQAKAKQMHSEALQGLAGGLPIGGFADILSQLPNSNPDAGKS
jgi:nucleoid-associated protein EbfC